MGEKGEGILSFSWHFFGVCGLLSWNAILSNFDLFFHFQGAYKPSFYYTNLNFVLNVALQFYLVFAKKRFTYRSQLLFSVVLSLLSLIVLPIIVIFVPGLTGFLITALIMLTQGFSNALVLSSLYGLVSYLPFAYIIAMSTGQGISGILMNVIRYIVILIFGSDPENEGAIVKGALVFFALAAIIIFAGIFFVIALYKNQAFIDYIKNTDEIEAVAGFQSLITEKNPSVNEDRERGSEQLSQLAAFKKLNNMLMDINFLTFLTYTTTFLCFPGITFAFGLFGLDDAYRINTLNLIFNLFDTIGRNFPKLIACKKLTFYWIVFVRTILILTFPIVTTLQFTYWLSSTALSILAIINLILLAFSNGYITSMAFSLAPDQVPNEYKGKAGSSVSFFLILGIFIGSTLATIVMSNYI